MCSVPGNQIKEHYDKAVNDPMQEERKNDHRSRKHDCSLIVRDIRLRSYSLHSLRIPITHHGTLKPT